MLVLVFSDFCHLRSEPFKPENVCAYTDTVLLPKWGLFRQALRWEQLELSCQGRAHLGLGCLKTDFLHVRISAEWALKLPSKLPLGNVLSLKTALCYLLPSLHASRFMHFPLTLFSMLSLQFFLDEMIFLPGKCSLFQCFRTLFKITWYLL